MNDFTDTLLKQIIEKFGKPEKKTFGLVKERVEYKSNNHKLSVWQNWEGISRANVRFTSDFKSLIIKSIFPFQSLE